MLNRSIEHLRCINLGYLMFMEVESVLLTIAVAAFETFISSLILLVEMDGLLQLQIIIFLGSIIFSCVDLYYFDLDGLEIK